MQFFVISSEKRMYCIQVKNMILYPLGQGHSQAQDISVTTTTGR